MKSVQFSDSSNCQIIRRWGQYKFKKEENEHAYTVYVSQCVIPFQKIVSFAVLLTSLPQIIFLGF